MIGAWRAALAAFLLLGACGWPPPPPETPAGPSADHVIRYTAKLTFDGELVEFDELVHCRSEYRGRLFAGVSLKIDPVRRHVVRSVPGGGIIGFKPNREHCFQLGDAWGYGGTHTEPPEGWTPVVEWFDHRDIRKAERGIVYMSERALTAKNGRLRIVEPFRLTIPEHPPSEALLAEAARQAEERKFWLGGPRKPGLENPRQMRDWTYSWRRLPWMFRIPESLWRNPVDRLARAREVHQIKRPVERIDALARYLEARRAGGGAIVLPYAHEIENRDVSNTLALLRVGRSDTGIPWILGIPQSRAPRHGMTLTDRGFARLQKNPLWFDRFDEYIPLNCVDGVLTPDLANPGLIHWVRNKCTYPEFAKGIDFFGLDVEGSLLPLNGKLVFDRSTGDLWWIRRSP